MPSVVYINQNRLFSCYLNLKGREKLAGSEGKFYLEWLHTLHFPQDIIRMVKFWRGRCARHVARMEMKNCIENFSLEAWREETTWETWA